MECRLPFGETHARVRTTERAGGVPLLMVHGFTGGIDVWGSDLLDRLSRERDLILLELPGHGQSDPLRDPGAWSADRIRDGVYAVQRSVAGEGGCDWLGYSMGGRIALHAACSGVPIRTLYLESVSPGIEDPEDRRRRVDADQLWIDLLRSASLDTFVSRWMSQEIFRGRERLPEAVLSTQRAIRMQADPETLAACLMGLGTGTSPQQWTALANLSMPTHLLVGELDEKYARLSARMKSEIRGATREVVAGVGHTVHLEAPDSWLAWVAGGCA